MLSTWLHKEAIASRNACVTEAQDRLQAIVRTRESRAKTVKHKAEEDREMWDEMVAEIKSLA
jgi:hypothetical protein